MDCGTIYEVEMDSFMAESFSDIKDEFGELEGICPLCEKVNGKHSREKVEISFSELENGWERE